MLNPFPDLLVYGLLAPFIIRISLGAALLYLGIEHYRTRQDGASLVRPYLGRGAPYASSILGGCAVLCGITLVFGAWTQIAALVACSLSLMPLLLRSHHEGFSPYSRGTYGLLFVMSLSLLLSGAGAFAIDIPL